MGTGGFGGTGRGFCLPGTKAIFCREMQFKHDVPHDIGSIGKKHSPKSLGMSPWLIGVLWTRKLLEAADSLDILDRYSLY